MLQVGATGIDGIITLLECLYNGIMLGNFNDNDYHRYYKHAAVQLGPSVRRHNVSFYM
jgi:hypothetical protein